jgi:hypothetical protein
MRRWWLALAVVLLPARALAHPFAASSFDARVDGREVRVGFRLDPISVEALGRYDATPERELLLGYLDERFAVAADGVACGRAAPTRLARDAGADRVVLDVAWLCPAPPARLRIDSTLFADDDSPHEVIGTVRLGRGRAQRFFFGGGGSAAVVVPPDVDRASYAGGFRTATPPPGAFAASPPPAPRQASRATFAPFVRMGFWHILGGLDHLLFVATLVLAAASWRRLALVITSFTLAHSLALALGALGVAAPAPRAVEPLIALTIVWVAAEAAVRPERGTRLGLTFCFGLVHGFGFAGALSSLGLSRTELLAPLFAFNLGVELGQLLVVAPLFPLVLFLRRSPPAFLRARLAGCTAIALTASVWLFARL